MSKNTFAGASLLALGGVMLGGIASIVATKNHNHLQESVDIFLKMEHNLSLPLVDENTSLNSTEAIPALSKKKRVERDPLTEIKAFLKENPNTAKAIANTGGYLASAVFFSYLISIPTNNAIINAQAKGINLPSSFKDNFKNGGTYNAATNYLLRKSMLLLVGGNASEYAEGFTENRNVKFLYGAAGGTCSEAFSSPIEMTEKVSNIEKKSKEPERLLSRVAAKNGSYSPVGIRGILNHPAYAPANVFSFVTIAAMRNSAVLAVARGMRNHHKNYAIEHGEELSPYLKTTEIVAASAAAGVVTSPLDTWAGRFAYEACYNKDVTLASSFKSTVEFAKANPKVLAATAAGRLLFTIGTVGALYSGDVVGKAMHSSMQRS